MIVPGGGISLDGTHWVRCRPGFLLPVRVLSRLFRRLFLARLADAHTAGRLAFFGEIRRLVRREAFVAHLAPLRRKNWFVYAKPPFAGPEAVLAYLARYTHRVAISNSRLLRLDARGVTFRYKDYRRNGRERFRTMTLEPDEFIRRFLLHVLLHPRRRSTRQRSMTTWTWPPAPRQDEARKRYVEGAPQGDRARRNDQVLVQPWSIEGAPAQTRPAPAREPCGPRRHYVPPRATAAPATCRTGRCAAGITSRHEQGLRSRQFGVR
jgi:Putative transposase